MDARYDRKVESFPGRRKICHAGKTLCTLRTTSHLLSPLTERRSSGELTPSFFPPWSPNVFGKRVKERVAEATREWSVKNANRVKRSAAIFLATYVTGVETTGERKSGGRRAQNRRENGRQRISVGIAMTRLRSFGLANSRANSFGRRRCLLVDAVPASETTRNVAEKKIRWNLGRTT